MSEHAQRAGASAPGRPTGDGEPLPLTVRQELEPAFGHDLGQLRIHPDSPTATRMGAAAYTLGRHIAFAPGRWDPARPDRRLLAHEVAHTIQQSRDGTTSTDLDAAAESATARVLGGETGVEVAGSAALEPALAPAGTTPFFGPPAATGLGAGFDDFIFQVDNLEALAIADGYTFTQRVTAFRKIFYSARAPATSYAGVTTGGGAWNILIPGAAGTELPPSWRDPAVSGALDYLKARQVQSVGGVQVDIGHLLAGADARAHPTAISLPSGRLRSNVEATTFTGDLGSVVVEYYHASTRSFYDTAMTVQSGLLTTTYASFASDPDLRGDADAHALTLDPSRTVGQNLLDYYAATSGGARRRWSGFAAAIGLGSLSGGRFSGDTPAWRRDLRGEIMGAALAYAAANGWRIDVVNVLSDPGPGLLAPTIWEAYSNISGWVLDRFVAQVLAGAAAE